MRNNIATHIYKAEVQSIRKTPLNQQYTFWLRGVFLRPLLVSILMARAIIKCLKLTVTVIGNCITIGWCISISLRINSDSYCLSVRLSTVTVFCTGIILSYPFEITDSLDWVHFWIANNSICCNNPSLDLISKCYFYIIYRSNALYYYIEFLYKNVW